MKIVQAHALDSLDDYAMVDAPLPQAGAGEVRIRVAACGVGYVEALRALGKYQVKPPLPYTPGNEFSGVVDQVGAGVTDVKPGDHVMATSGGAFAEFVVVAREQVDAMPSGLSFDQAAGVRVNYETALFAFRNRARLAPGETVLVFGAAGGTGVAAIQTARAMGARVIAAASTPAKREFALAQGASVAIDTEVEGWRDRLKEATGGKGPDVIFDPVCGPLFDPAFRSLAWNGRHLVVGFVGGPIPALKSNLTLLKGAALVGVDLRQFALNEPQAAATNFADIQRWLGDGTLNPPVGKVFAFEEYREALDFAFSGSGMAKTVVRIAQD